VLPYALLLETAKVAFYDSVLLGGVRSDELLAQPVVVAGGAKPPVLEDHSVVHGEAVMVGDWNS
jgi:hypothetical protein